MIEWSESDSRELSLFIKNTTAGKKLIAVTRQNRPPIARTLSPENQPTFEAISIGACQAHGWEECSKFILGLAHMPETEAEQAEFMETT